MRIVKTIALVAHDNRKKDLIEWVRWNYMELLKHNLICTGTTGGLIEETLKFKIEDGNISDWEMADGKKCSEPQITKLKSGPLGGDQQLGSLIAEEKIDIIIFFWDPMQPQPHDVDVKALLRIAVVYNVPTACNRASADFVISSPLIKEKYESQKTDYTKYLNRNVGQ